ncbi:unnamed protein product [Cuscuta epithymum]|uniref:Uncharacterized protein n=1 Tax=Cuscuta epithymum TaxID=186058 RepID=A0AAV0CAX3_9ASTE|nr:unnamed protein product [Cuscuta epithymum]
MQSSTNFDNKKSLKRSRSSSCEMPLSDVNSPKPLDDYSMFPVEEIVQYPLPGYGAPISLSFSPDDSLVTFLFSPNQSLNRKVYAFDLKSGRQELLFSPPDGGLDENNLSAEEKLRRERSRERGLGVTRYEWVKTSSTRKTIMVPLPAGIYFQDVFGGVELKIPSTSSLPIIDPHISPDGTKLAFVKDSELNVLDLLYNHSNQLTSGAKGNVIVHGLAEYIALEEMDRKSGFWWSLDSKYLAFTKVDSSDIPLLRIMHHGKSWTGPEAQEDHAYPFSGESNAKVQLGVVSSNGGPVTWMDVVCGGKFATNDEDEYLVSVNWIYGNILTAQVLNRSHTKLKILKFDIKTGKKEVLLVEENDTWINLHDCFTPLETNSPGQFLWSSEKTGFRHLYLHDSNGECLGPLTQGHWMVEQVVGINEAAGVVYFTGTFDSPLESHLYSCKLFPALNSPETPLRLTQGRGKHVVVLDHQMHKFVDIFDSLVSPPRISLFSLHDGSFIMHLHDQPPPMSISRFKMLQLVMPEIIQIQAKEGSTTLYGALYKPDEARFGPPPYKTMIHVYGGPGVQLVTDSWANTVDMRAQFLRSKGILVWKMDNRGTARRGLKFEGALKHNCGGVESEDQATGAEWLVKHGLSKEGHIGLYGWSYGGYLSAMTLAKFPELFRCAVSGAPVTSWDGYDTFYTEKYMGRPDENPSGYEESSVMHHVSKMKGELILVHGMIDENVHFRHTARLINALAAAGKFYELLIFPDERHMPRRHRDRVYMESRIWDFIKRNL